MRYHPTAFRPLPPVTADLIGGTARLPRCGYYPADGRVVAVATDSSSHTSARLVRSYHHGRLVAVDVVAE